MSWLVDTHLKPIFKGRFVKTPGALGAESDPATRAHAYYVLAGAGSLIFAVAPECRRLTGIDPANRETIERHANLMANLLVP